MSVLLLGLDGAGKTSLLYRMKLQGIPAEFTATTGFNYEVIKLPSSPVSIHAWDLAGSPELRRFWKFYYEAIHVDVLIFVVRASDASRLKEAASLYQHVTNEERLRDALQLLVLNREDDAKYADSRPEVIEKISTLFGVDHNSPYEKIVELNASTSQGLDALYAEIENYF